MDAALSMPPDKHFATQAGVEIKISGGPANAARYKPNSETITAKHILKQIVDIKSVADEEINFLPKRKERYFRRHNQPSH